MKLSLILRITASAIERDADESEIFINYDDIIFLGVFSILHIAPHYA